MARQQRHTLGTELETMTTLLGDADLAAKIVSVIAEAAASDAGLTDDDFLKKIKVGVHNVFVVAQRDPRLRAKREQLRRVEVNPGDEIILRGVKASLRGLGGTVESVNGDEVVIALDSYAAMVAGRYAVAGRMKVKPTMVTIVGRASEPVAEEVIA